MADMARLRQVMVDTQVRPSDVTKFPIIAAMLDVPREAFVPSAQRDVAYSETPLPLGDGREMLEPRTLAKLLDLLDVEREDDVLVIGGNLGYSTALLAHMARSVVSIECDDAMVGEAEAALTGLGVDNAVVLCAPLTDGKPDAAPFDVILIEGAVMRFPDVLLDQLAEGGRIVAIVQGDAVGEARIGIKSEGRIGWRYAFNADGPVLPGFAVERQFAL
ncbi:protein-L-isoaspartate O-methyltransferase [Jannaschia sp. LMIT008]|uniref:protein-L-isoaspartate O-methyltransferase family protein n=1 Tax=Jannaschia maritima TaxID=3032585 RepID=UPI0028116891|nr:protein-L-isoaspartate O-methyltransferase [Jannaschia sp. LMIT008]